MALENLHEQESTRKVSEASEIADNDVKKVTFQETEKSLQWWDDDPRKKYQWMNSWQEVTTSEVVVREKINDNSISEREVKHYTNVSSIRNIPSNESEIPDSDKHTIIDIINKLSDFEQILIVWCTDWSPISSPQAIDYNQKEFEKIRTKYEEKWWKCPTLQELLSDTFDPQNKILWYRRAMEWVLSLWLNPAQMKKVKIDNKFWSNSNDTQERWFDIKIDRTEIIRRVKIEVSDSIKEIYWKLQNRDFGYNWSEWGYNYILRTTEFATDVNNMRTKLYKKLLWDLWNNMNSEDPSYQEKKAFIDEQVKRYLEIARFLIPYYDEANWLTHKNEEISRRDLYLIKLSNILDEKEFKEVLEWTAEWLNIMWNKKLNDIKDDEWNSISISDFIKNKHVTWVWNSGSGPDWYHYYDDKGGWNRLGRRISERDYILLWIYFELKKGTK